MSVTKKTTGKKSAKKKTAKIPPRLLTFTQCKPSLMTVRLYRSAGYRKPNSIRWQNKSKNLRELKFIAWPFLGGKKTIRIGAGKTSARFTVNPRATRTYYHYSISLAPGEHVPPGPPQIEIYP